MASTPVLTSNHIIGRKFSAIPPPHSPALRISAGFATAGRRIQEASSQAASLYEVLGIQTWATSQEIKSAYRKLARVLHPDVAASDQGHDDDSKDASSAEEFMRVHAAYATLSDPEKRAVYDSALFRQPHGAAISSPRGYYRRRRTWETDQCW